MVEVVVALHDQLVVLVTQQDQMRAELQNLADEMVRLDTMIQDAKALLERCTQVATLSGGAGASRHEAGYRAVLPAALAALLVVLAVGLGVLRFPPNVPRRGRARSHSVVPAAVAAAPGPYAVTVQVTR